MTKQLHEALEAEQFAIERLSGYLDEINATTDPDNPDWDRANERLEEYARRLDAKKIASQRVLELRGF